MRNHCPQYPYMMLYTRLRYSRRMKADQSGDTAVEESSTNVEPTDNRAVATKKSTSGSKDKSK